MSKLIKPIRKLYPMECHRCGDTYSIFTLDIDVSDVKAQGDIIETNNIYHKSIAVCPKCGYTIDVRSADMLMFPDTPYYNNMLEEYYNAMDEAMEYARSYANNIFDRRDIDEELIRKYS